MVFHEILGKCRLLFDIGLGNAIFCDVAGTHASTMTLTGIR